MKKIFLICSIALFTFPANAGWFGPSDYRECVLSEMKGAAPNMLGIVKGLCDKRFPCPELELARKDHSDYVAVGACPGGNLGDQRSWAGYINTYRLAFNIGASAPFILGNFD